MPPSTDEMPRNRLVFVVEDSEQDYDMFVRCTEKLGIGIDIRHFETGDLALEHLSTLTGVDREPSSIPKVILLDLHLPGTDGREVLRQMREVPEFVQVPIVIFSTSTQPADIEESYQNGANAYIIKPMNVRELRDRVEVILKHWLFANAQSYEVSQLT